MEKIMGPSDSSMAKVMWNEFLLSQAIVLFPGHPFARDQQNRFMLTI